MARGIKQQSMYREELEWSDAIWEMKLREAGGGGLELFGGGGGGGGEKREHTTAGAPLGLHFCSSMRAITFGAIVYYCRRHKEHKSMSLNDKRFAGVSALKGRRCMTIQTGV